MSRAKVHLVGAGPGDPDLLTVKAAKLLALADVVVHDRLIGAKILDLAPPTAERVDVGKSLGAHRVTQSGINRLLVELARPERVLIRLKGGDPFLFGRGGEEIGHLLACGVEVDVVPGITSAAGCAAVAGIPLTHRGLATGVRFITAHTESEARSEIDWRGLADPWTTLVIFMGLGKIAELARKLMQAGLPPTTPVAAIENGTFTEQRISRADLQTIADIIHNRAFEAPVLFIVGRVVSVLDGWQPGRGAGQDLQPNYEDREWAGPEIPLDHLMLHGRQ
ncbi:MAG: uroporphyrinogen-III C-methyltransferase [Pseudomonadota bacterium]